MNLKSRRLFIWITVLSILILGIFFIYNQLFPKGPITDLIPNPVTDKAIQSKNIDESSIATNPQKNAYFGDLHVHSAYSFDAFIGGVRTTPEMAYQFAQGEAIELFGKKVKIQQPLDFAAVTDHAEYLGEQYSIIHKGAPGHQSLAARYLRSIGTDTIKMREFFNRLATGLGEQSDVGPSHIAFFQGYETTQKAWDIELEAAERHYQPGKFTTFAAYEWSMGDALDYHLHRNIIFRDMKVPSYPISAFEASTVEELWQHLDDITKEGATVLSIPHNSNLSNGYSFSDTDKDGKPIDNKYAQLSSTYEPLIEIHQAKGNSEVHADFWKNDEFADFENASLGVAKERDYVRYGLKKGLEYKDKLGVNPFKYGLIGSTDTHNGTPGNTEEDDEFIGNHATVDFGDVRRRNTRWILEPSKYPYQVINPGGLVGVWAEANTRGHLYDAMARKETFATSGGRIKVRLFGGYDFKKQYVSYEEMVKEGYDKGVPMGSDLKHKATAPSFIVWAAKDPTGANLDRIQIIKGWYKDGKLQEKIYNVALSDNRTLNADGSVPDNGAIVDMKTGEWSKDKGASELLTVWTDPDFDASVNSFYYARVLEIPTASWRLWDTIRYGTKFPKGTKLTIRERAWSSPIWWEAN